VERPPQRRRHRPGPGSATPCTNPPLLGSGASKGCIDASLHRKHRAPGSHQTEPSVSRFDDLDGHAVGSLLLVPAMTDHTLLVLSVSIGALTFVVAAFGVVFTYLSVKYESEQVKIMREEQAARIESEGAPLNIPSQGTVWVGGPLGRFLKGAAERLYGGR